MTATIPVNLMAALDYASRGWRVFPVHCAEGYGINRLTCSCGDLECGSPAKHPRTERGLSDATTDETTIRGWWRKWPTASVAIATGEGFGVVLDVDAGKGGTESLARLMDEHGELPETLEAETGGGGLHIIMAHPGRKVRNSVGRAGWLNEAGLDIRGDGGYIVAPPSNHMSGRRYAWKSLAGPGEVTPCQMPAWLLERMDKPQRVVTPGVSIGDDCTFWLGRALAKANEGNRNDTGYWLACQLRDNKIPESVAASAMRDYAARCPRSGTAYTEREAMASLRSAYSAPARPPARGERRYVASSAPAQKQTTPAVGASGELSDYIDGVCAGRIFNVPWPSWPHLTRQTQANLPGSVTMITGEPGVGKTFLGLQCIRDWHANGYEPAAFFVEKNRRFYSMRLLAQIMGSGGYVDHDWIKGHPKEVSEALAGHGQYIDLIGKCIHTEPKERVTLPSLIGWIRQMASAGKRMILVDPITAVSAGNDRWTKDEDFMLAAQNIAASHDVSVVLVSHPRKGNRPGEATMHDQAGGAAFSRFVDTSIWVQRCKKPKRVEVLTPCGPAVDEYSIFFHLLKTRDGKGAGRAIAFRFGEGLAFAEQGLVLREVKKRDEDQDE